MTLPTDYNARKALPLYDFLTGYFPDAIVELVKVSVAGNAQHNPGEPLHWARGKSMDQLNTAMRHQFDHGAGHVYDDAGLDPAVLKAIGGYPPMHLAKAAWRLLAEIQLICEAREKVEAEQTPKVLLDSYRAVSAALELTDVESVPQSAAKQPAPTAGQPADRGGDSP